VIKKFMLLNLLDPLKKKVYSYSSLKPTSKGRQEEIKIYF
jgi:hypothetical protein